MSFYYKHNGVLYEIQLTIEELCDLINIFFEEKPYEALLELEKRWLSQKLDETDHNWFLSLVNGLELDKEPLNLSDDKKI